MAHILGIEGGGTRTTVLLVGNDDEVLTDFVAGPANLRLMESGQLVDHLFAISRRLPGAPDAIGIGLAGARTRADLDRLQTAAARVWPGIPCAPSDDLVTALEALNWDSECNSQVLVLSGTGSCQMGRDRNGNVVRMGGRGHVLGDRGSGCEIAHRALRELMAEYDLSNIWPRLGGDILTSLQMNEPEDLIDWSLVASKTEIASLASVVFRALQLRPDDEIATRVLEHAAETLASDAVHCADRLTEKNHPVQFVFNGAVLLKNPEFLKQVSQKISDRRKASVFSPLNKPSAWGAVRLGQQILKSGQTALPADAVQAEELPKHAPPVWKPLTASPTEQRNPDTIEFSDLSIAAGIEVMANDSATITNAVFGAKDSIEWTVNAVIQAFEKGGRLIYTGAGTSGRLGVLDASECPPTFRASPEQVQGIIAGGRRALWSAVEGAEDDVAAGRQSIIHRDVTDKDVVIGISASGHAPFLWGCLQEASERGAKTVLLTCHPGYRDHPLPDCVIAADTGPEVLHGSTRLKAGTATKIILNMITTLAMTHSGKVMSNLMIDLNPSNIKLRARAVRIVSAIADVNETKAKAALEKSAWVVRSACEQLMDSAQVTKI